MRGGTILSLAFLRIFQGLANVDGTQGQWQLVSRWGWGILPWAQINNSEESPQEEGILLNDLDLDSDIIQDSPVLQDWLQDIPDIADEISQPAQAFGPGSGSGMPNFLPVTRPPAFMWV